jgi:hypothetical protein
MALSWVEQDHAITVYVHFNEKHQINNLKMKETIACYMDILLISQGGKRVCLLAKVGNERFSLRLSVRYIGSRYAIAYLQNQSHF